MTEQPLQPVLAPHMLRETGIAHGFFTRQGGVSEGIYASLNAGLSSHDKRSSVEENRRRIAARLGIETNRLLTPYQIHSNIVITAHAPWRKEVLQGDALVTNTENLAIGILTADCGTVLFADRQARIIGAAHAGWKGALNGVLQNTIDIMVKLGAKAENILAVSGPSISAENYEVGEEFRQAFMAKDTAYARYFIPWTGRKHNLPGGQKNVGGPTYHCDLQQFIHDRLVEKSVQVEDLHICTYANEQHFFSFRRATHKGEKDYGRQISAICLR